MLIEFTSLVQILENFKSFSSFYVMYEEKEICSSGVWLCLIKIIHPFLIIKK